MIGVEYMNDDPSEVDVLYGKVSKREANVHMHCTDNILKLLLCLIADKLRSFTENRQ